MTLSVEIKQEFERRDSQNVIGILPGAERPDEAILYTAHYDHLGRCKPVNGDDIGNGAVDNATGVPGILEITRANVSAGQAQRTTAYIAFAAEEQNHLRSAYYAAPPPGKTVAAFNIDTMSTYGAARDITIVRRGKSDLDGLFESAVLAACPESIRYRFTTNR